MNGQPVSDRFSFKTADDLRRKAEDLGIPLPFSDDIGVAARSRPRRRPARAQPDRGAADGRLRRRRRRAPGELTLRRYQRFAAGGSGLIWVEATGVAGDGRANPRQLWITPATAPAFRSLAERSRRRPPARGSARRTCRTWCCS